MKNITRFVAKDANGGLYAGPVAARAAKPRVATAAASAHWRRRVKSPMATASLTAPMVQKPVRCTSAPNSADSTKAAHSTCWFSVDSSAGVMRGF